MAHSRIIGPPLALVASLLACATPDRYTPTDAAGQPADPPDAQAADVAAKEASGEMVDSPVIAQDLGGSAGDAPPGSAPVDVPPASTDGSCGTLTDPRNCGTCGHDCTNLPNVLAGAVTCQTGKCVLPAGACATGYAHCNSNPDDGCEASLAKPETCGRCDMKCAAGELCSASGGAYRCATSDGTAPTILTMSPANAATGVRNNAKIVVTFSEPMDRMKTQAAFASDDIQSPSFSWDSSGTILTVAPGGGLAYASGLSTSVTARSYSYSVATSAADLAGNRLQQASATTFKTMRRISATTPGAIEAMSGTVSSGQPAVFGDGYAWVSCNNVERAFLTFDLSGLPGGIDSVETATANWAYAANLGVPAAQVEVSHLVFSSPSTQLFDAPATVVGALSAPQGRATTLSGTKLQDAIWTDYQTRTGSDRRTQYRMRLLNCSGVDGASFSLNESTVSIQFLIP